MKNIILVEDNRIERRNISRVIESINGCNLSGVFFNGLDAMNFLEENDVDIVITDVQMALMDGIELIKNIRSKGIETEIIIISGYQDFDNAKSAVGLDVVDYVMKPIINNELETAISKAIDKCDEKRLKKADYEQMQKQVESSKLILQEQFVRGLVINSDVSDDYIQSNEKLLGIDISGGYKLLLVFKIKEEQSKRTLETIYALKECISGFEREFIKFYPFIINDNEIGAIIVARDGGEFVSSCIQLKNKIINSYCVKTFVALSTVSSDVSDISRQYDECKSVLNDFKDKWNVVAMYDSYEGAGNDFAEIQKRARHLLDANDIKGMSEYLHSCLIHRKNKSDLNDKNFAIIFVNLLELILCQYGLTFDDFEILSVKEIWRKLDDFESIVDINNFMLNLLKSVVEKINEIDNDKFRVVKKIKNIINEHYSEHITVKFIANEVNFSTKQVHRIFTQETGMTIFEYLTNYRMEMAKKLLLENKVVDDVVFEVGYKDKKYFYEIFKEKTGMSPKQFKDQGKL